MGFDTTITVRRTDCRAMTVGIGFKILLKDLPATLSLNADKKTLYCYDGSDQKELKKGHYGDTWCQKVGCDTLFQLSIEATRID